MKANKASSTALLIAKSMVFNSQDKHLKKLISERSAQLSYCLLQNVIGWKAWVYKQLGKAPIAHSIVRRIENRYIPGMSVHYMVRKLCIEDLINKTMNSWGKLDQLVIIGAGYDTLGLRMAEANNSLRVFEIDHPATQSSKCTAFENKDIVKPDNLQLIAADLAVTPLDQLLVQIADYSHSANTIFLAEGLMMYLTPETVLKLLGVIKSIKDAQAQFIFTYMMNDSSGKPGFINQSNRVNTWLANHNERFLWGMSKQELHSFLSQNNFEVLEHINHDNLYRDYIASNGLSCQTAAGENICLVTTLNSKL